MFQGEQYLILFTDGSKIKDGTSVTSSVVCPRLQLADAVTINAEALTYTAESLDIFNAMDLALSHRQRSVNIFTDSLSVVLALSNPTLQADKNIHLLAIRQTNVEYYRNQNDQRTQKIYLVPADVGITGNKLADTKLLQSSYL